MIYHRLTDDDRAYIEAHWGKISAREIAENRGCYPNAVRYHAARAGLGPGIDARSQRDAGWIILTTKSWPRGQRFQDIENPDCDRYPSLGYRPLRRPAPEASPGNGTRLCAEMA